MDDGGRVMEDDKDLVQRGKEMFLSNLRAVRNSGVPISKEPSKGVEL
jgi:hypothetical protein